MAYMIDIVEINPNSLGGYNTNVLYYAVLSGSIKAMEYAIKTLEIDTNNTG
ncbi:hypothetical protein [Coxiella endosymbiont of Ornithodoros maritimus]|uniref:hypothetical protein n=1 Tax=Coxiella endosymbiont of Ornithodoros maritimus TaxID=1656172 RepID=UPI002264DD7D|nr:hypothetical protein [Coxiella endosymbiont of Ornithodoros maritimus]